MILRPTKGRVVIKVDEEVQTSAGGIVLPTTDKATTGIVLACYNDELVVGDRVLFGKFAGTPINVQNEDFTMMNIDEVLAVIEK